MPALLGALLCAAALLATPGKALAQAQKPYPAGIIWLPQADTVQHRIELSHWPEWQYSFVDGIRLRTAWNVVQPTSSTYDWSTIDQALSLAAQNGKKVGVSIGSGIATPQWVYDNGATKYQLLDGSGNSMPIPWEPAYYNQWLDFVRTFGTRYDSNPALVYVIITGFMQSNGMGLADGQDEINLAANAVQSGYPDLSSAYLFAAETITSAIMDAFPSTACILTLQAPFPDLADLQGTVRDWGLAAYPGRFGTMRNGLMAVPAPHNPPPPPAPYPFGYQMICAAIDDPATLYQDPDPVPIPIPPVPLQDALENGVTLGAQYVEVYGTDLELEIHWPVLGAEGVKLNANQPSLAPEACYPNFVTAEGCDALSLLSTGAGNTALGWRSLFLDTTGSFNTGVGGGALALNNGSSNTALGAAALLLNTTGNNNTAVGTDTLVFNDSGSSNTASGYFALMNNTIGGSNTAIGDQALTANTSGNNNTALGNLALQSSQITSDNVCVGTEAGSGISTANNDIIIGHHSGAHSVFGQESDRCFIENISGAPVSAATAAIVIVDSDGRLGTVSSDGPAAGGFSSKGIRPQAIPDAANEAMLDLQVEDLEATIAQQQQQLETLTARLRKQTAQIQNVNSQLEKRKLSAKMIVKKLEDVSFRDSSRTGRTMKGKSKH